MTIPNSMNNSNEPVVRIGEIKKMLGEEKFDEIAETIFCEKKSVTEHISFVTKETSLTPKAAKVMVLYAQDNEQIASEMLKTSGLLFFGGLLVSAAGPLICWLTSFLGFVFPILFFTPIIGYAAIFFGINRLMVGLFSFCRAAWFYSFSIVMFVLSYIGIVVALVYYHVK